MKRKMKWSLAERKSGHTTGMRRAKEAYDFKKFWTVEGSRGTLHLPATTASQRTTNQDRRTTNYELRTMSHEPRTVDHHHHHRCWL